MADAEDLKSSGDFSSCGFDSHPGHHLFFEFNRLCLIALRPTFEGYTPTMEMLRGFVNADVVPEVPTAAATFGSWVGCALWG